MTLSLRLSALARHLAALFENADADVVDLDLWDEMRLAAIMARATAADPSVISSSTALRLATRGSPLALAQARWVAERYPVESQSEAGDGAIDVTMAVTVATYAIR